jgi:hypothetical protein
MRALGSNIAELSRETGIKRPTVTNRLNGSTDIERPELVGFALVLGVPVEVLEMDEDDALRWIADHRDIIKRNTCFAITDHCAA